MADEGNGWTGMESCMGAAPDVGAMSGTIHGTEAFAKDFKDWTEDIGKAATVDPALAVAEMGRAAWVGTDAGHDAVNSYREAEPIAEQRWQDLCGITDQAVQHFNEYMHPPSPAINDGFLVLDTPAPAISWGNSGDSGHNDSGGSGWGGSGDSGFFGSILGAGHDSSTHDSGTHDSGTGMDSGSSA